MSEPVVWIEHPYRFVREALAEVLVEFGSEVLEVERLDDMSSGGPHVIVAAGDAARARQLQLRWPEATHVPLGLGVGDEVAGASAGEPIGDLETLCRRIGLELDWSFEEELPAVETAVTVHLGRRGQQVLEMIAAGYTSREIGLQIGIAPGTVEQHKRVAMRKMGVATVNEAVAKLASSAAVDGVRRDPEVTGRTPTVVLAGQPALLLDLIGRCLQTRGHSIVGRSSSASAIVRLAQDRRPDVALTTLQIGADLVTGQIPVLLSAGVRLLIVGFADAEDVLTEALLHGASGYVPLAETSPKRLAASVEAVAEGGATLHSAVARAVLEQWRQVQARDNDQGREPASAVSLSPREIEVLTLLTEGLSGKEIAKRLSLAPKTIEHHKSRIYSKLGVRNQAQAVSRAIETGLLPQR